MRVSERGRRSSSAVLIYVIILMAMQVFLVTVAAEAFLADEASLAWATAIVSVVLFAAAALGCHVRIMTERFNFFPFAAGAWNLDDLNRFFRIGDVHDNHPEFGANQRIFPAILGIAADVGEFLSGKIECGTQLKVIILSNKRESQGHRKGKHGRANDFFHENQQAIVL